MKNTISIFVILFLFCGTIQKNYAQNNAEAKKLFEQRWKSNNQAEKQTLADNIMAIAPDSEYGLCVKLLLIFNKGQVGDRKYASVEFRPIMKKYPNFAFGYYVNGLISIYTGYDNRDPISAVEWLTKAIELRPNEAKFYYTRAIAYQYYPEDTKDYTKLVYEKCIKDLDKALALDPTLAENIAQIRKDVIGKKTTAEYTVKLDAKLALEKKEREANEKPTEVVKETPKEKAARKIKSEANLVEINGKTFYFDASNVYDSGLNKIGSRSTNSGVDFDNGKVKYGGFSGMTTTKNGNDLYYHKSATSTVFYDKACKSPYLTQTSDSGDSKKYAVFKDKKEVGYYKVAFMAVKLKEIACLMDYLGL